jgi:hypothetical protein
VAILLLLLRLTFVAPQNIYHTDLLNPMADSLAVLKHRITELEKRDSIIIHDEKKIINNIRTMPIDSVADIISKHIRQREMLYGK